MSDELRIALMDLYHLMWSDLATYESPVAGFVLLSVDDDERINTACERIENLIAVEVGAS